MIEPEVAFNDIHDNMDLAENMLKYICSYVMENCADDLQFLNDRDAQEQQAKPQNEQQKRPVFLKKFTKIHGVLFINVLVYVLG